MSDASSPQKSASELLATPVQFLKGVGPQRAELLERLELRFARDVLFFFPRDYQDMSQLRAIAELRGDRLLSDGRLDIQAMNRNVRNIFAVGQGDELDRSVLAPRASSCNRTDRGG